MQNNFVPYLDNIITKQIQKNMNNNEFDSYHASQTYFILTDLSYQNSEIIENRFAQC